MEILKPNQLKEKFNDPWIAPYQKVLTMVDGNKVEIVEFHPCISGSHWLLHQYKNNSDLLILHTETGTNTFILAI